MGYLDYILNIALLALGFGFVIFWHELGHFLAAKWVGIKVEQFAVGFGHALLAWRKGIGLRVGTTTPEYERRAKEYFAGKMIAQPNASDAPVPSAEQITRAADEMGLGETEYRLNWIPLGGYVKMLGQDDLNPNNVVDDPRAYNRKPIGSRMIVVSAGVVMNIILAAILFMGLFMWGFKAPAALVGDLAPDGPARNVTRIVDGKPQRASLLIGDQILTYDGRVQHDFTKISLNVALSKPGDAVPIRVKHLDETEETFTITPQRMANDPKGFISIGIEPPVELAGLDGELVEDKGWEQRLPKDWRAIGPGDVITAVNGKAVQPKDYHVFDAAVQAAAGRPVELTVKRKGGAVETVSLQTYFGTPIFGKSPLNFAGMVPRASVVTVAAGSPALGKLLPGDAIVKLTSVDSLSDPVAEELIKRLQQAGENERPVTLEILRDGKPVTVAGIVPARISKERYGLGIQLGFDAEPVIGETLPSSSADAAGVPEGARVTAVNGQAVKTWYDVYRGLKDAAAGESVSVAYSSPTGTGEKTLKLTADEAEMIRVCRFETAISANRAVLRERTTKRQTSNPLTAAGWGVIETRDFVLQFYVTIRRMIDGSVSPDNLMGPLGIFHAGTRFAFKGFDWLVWFLAMISANLAVVNFLPIPIVDGGLFTFLLLEKIQGRPLSARAQSIAQVVGLALLLGVFLFVTYQDITRMAFGM